MQWRMIVSTSEDCGAETTQTLSNLGTGSYGRQHSRSELLQKPTGVSLELLFQLWSPNLIESCQNPRPSWKLSISNRRKVWVVCQDIFIPVLHKRQRSSLLNFLLKTVDEASQLTKCVVIARCLWLNKTVGIWNRTHVTDIAMLTINHIVP